MLINVGYTKLFTGLKEQTFRCVLFTLEKWFGNYSLKRLVIARNCLTIRLSSPYSSQLKSNPLTARLTIPFIVSDGRERWAMGERSAAFEAAPANAYREYGRAYLRITRRLPARSASLRLKATTSATPGDSV